VSADKGATGLLSELFAGLKRLPDMRAAIEALLLFLLVIAVGYWAASTGVLQSNAITSRGQLLPIWLSAFLVPALAEELVFRGWLRKGRPIAAVLSLLAFIAWHPLQFWLNLPFGRPEFLDPRFLSLVATLGMACTLSRLRSGSIWPAVIIHWGAAVVWIALYAS
jgi:predicted Abi (CAAX) family protease